MLLRWLFLLVWVVLPRCSATTRVVRLDTGRGSPVVHVPRSDGAAEPVELDEDEWQTHRGMTKAQGSAGPSKEWHHIVEQTEGNVLQFGPEAIHNTENVIALDKTLHDMVSAFYSRKYPLLTRSRDLTIREWLSTQSYAAQRDFGLLAVENIKKGIWR